MVDVMSSRYNLLHFVNNDASEQAKRVFVSDWPYLRLALLQSQHPHQHVWPYNVALALRVTLVRYDAQLAARRVPADSSDSLDNLLKTLDETSGSLMRLVGSDIPGELRSQIGGYLLQDAYAFPNDSLIYRDWKAISSVIKTIDQAVSNLEKHTRSLNLKNQTLMRQIREIEAFNYVQDQFIDKFRLGLPDVQRHVQDEMAKQSDSIRNNQGRSETEPMDQS